MESTESQSHVRVSDIAREGPAAKPDLAFPISIKQTE